MLVITGIRYNSFSTIRFTEPIIFTRGRPRLTARCIKPRMVLIKLWRGKTLITSWTISGNQLERAWLGVIYG